MESTSSDAVGGLLVLGFMLVCALVALGCFVVWLWMLIHALTNTGLSGSEKVAWVLLMFFVPFIGTLIYFFIGRPKAQQGRLPVTPPL